MKTGRVYCGISGWQYREFKGAFYPETVASSAQLQYYSERFSTVEVNSTFYHFSRPSTFAKWYDQTPPHFTFSIKANRYFTHDNRLSDPDDRLPEFLGSVDHLKEKLGAILFQLPPSLHFDPERLEAFVTSLPESTKYRYVIEFRHPSWEADATYEILEANNIAVCAYDLRGYQNDVRLTADFGYIRLHGPGKLPYRGSYPTETLESWSNRLRKWSASGRDAFIYFDNTMTADAVPNARTVIESLSESTESV